MGLGSAGRFRRNPGSVTGHRLDRDGAECGRPTSPNDCKIPRESCWLTTPIQTEFRVGGGGGISCGVGSALSRLSGHHRQVSCAEVRVGKRQVKLRTFVFSRRAQQAADEGKIAKARQPPKSCRVRPDPERSGAFVPHARPLSTCPSDKIGPRYADDSLGRKGMRAACTNSRTATADVGSRAGNLRRARAAPVCHRRPSLRPLHASAAAHSPSSQPVCLRDPSDNPNLGCESALILAGLPSPRAPSPDWKLEFVNFPWSSDLGGG